MYLALEGIDGVGKSTQMARLQKAFPGACFTKEPGATALGSSIRSLLLGTGDVSERAELLLFLADRAEHADTVLAPATAAKRHIISDRSLVSGIAYARGSFDPAYLCELNRFATAGLLPDHVAILTITAEGYRARIDGRGEGEDRIERRGIAYMMQTQQRMIEACESLGLSYTTLDAQQDETTIFTALKEMIHD